MRVRASGQPPTALRIYLSEIGRVPLLTVEEERELVQAFRRTRDPKLRARLVAANLRFVVKIANNWKARNAQVALDDLISEGHCGLLRAADKFDPAHKVRFVSYAVFWIRAYIGNFVLKNWSLVKYGTTQAQRKLFMGLMAARDELDRLHPGELEPDERVRRLARRLHVQPEEVREAELRLGSSDLSLDTPLNEDVSGRTFVDNLEADGPGPEEELLKADQDERRRRVIQHALKTLSRVERVIIERRHLGSERTTLNQLGDELGFSRERARQLEKRALAKLRPLLQGLR